MKENSNSQGGDELLLKDLIEVSHKYGKDSDYVIAGGGNTSYKNEKYLWIKGSGTSLATIEADGFVKMNRGKLQEISKKTYPNDSALLEEEVKNDLAAAIEDKEGKRPSVETSLHELLDYKYVVHTHPTKVNGLMCSNLAKDKTEELFGSEVLFIPYTDPGFTLFKVIDIKVGEYKVQNNRCPQILFLENHGVFVAANTTAEIDDLYDLINKKLNSQITTTPLTDKGKTVSSTINIDGEKKAKIEKTSPLISYFVENSTKFSSVSIAFTPDNIVYCKAFYPFVESMLEFDQVVKDFKNRKGYLPRAIGVKGVGLMVLEDTEKSANTVVEVYEDMLRTAVYAESFGGAKEMTPDQIAFIDNWEVENYRRKVAKE